MVSEEFKNIDTLVRLDWFVEEFDSRFLRYRFEGDGSLIQRAIQAAGRGRLVRAMMEQPLQKLAEALKLDLDYETIDTQIDSPNGPWCSIRYLSFGKEAEEFAETYATKFIIQLLNQKMAIAVPSLKFKVFWLPPLPVATTDEGHLMHTVRGIANIRKGRVEINLHTPRDYDNIFNTLVHEIIHICFLAKDTKETAGTVESRIDTYEKNFFRESQKEYQSQKNQVLESLQAIIEKELCLFRKANSALEEFKTNLMQANIVINTFNEFFDAILDEKIKPVLI